ncbi:MAG: hypothetical protein LH609_21960 [Rudanella sp.]|nr:hypothetical protein [Rudanella sp.]
MIIQGFRCLWGVTRPLSDALPLIQEAGYSGVEWKGANARNVPDFRQRLDDLGLTYIAQVHTAGHSVAEHLESFRELIENVLPLRPILINSQSGVDGWSLTEKEEIMGQALALEQTYGLPIAHETHRSRITFSPWDTSQLLTTFSDMKLTCDFSHWVTVCERLLDRESAILEQCAQHCVHIHARVGYEQGPQVTHPNAPEWAAQLAAHERWWQQIWQAQVQCGMAVSTLTPEYGPPNYHHTLPFSQEPVSDLWAICDWQWHREKAHFDRFAAEILTQSYS